MLAVATSISTLGAAAVAISTGINNLKASSGSPEDTAPETDVPADTPRQVLSLEEIVDFI